MSQITVPLEVFALETLTLDTLTSLLGWSTLINMGFLMFATLALVLFKNSITILHGSLFGLDPGDLKRAYFQYLAQYKIVIIVFNLVPYLVLRFIL